MPKYCPEQSRGEQLITLIPRRGGYSALLVIQIKLLGEMVEGQGEANQMEVSTPPTLDPCPLIGRWRGLVEYLGTRARPIRVGTSCA